MSVQRVAWRVGVQLTPEQRSKFALAASPIVASNSGGQSSRKSLNTREEDIIKTDQIIVRVFNNSMALDGCWRVWENIKGRPDFQGLSRSGVQSLRSFLLMPGWEGTLVVGRYAAHFPIRKGHVFLSEAAR